METKLNKYEAAERQKAVNMKDPDGNLTNWLEKQQHQLKTKNRTDTIKAIFYKYEKYKSQWKWMKVIALVEILICLLLLVHFLSMT